MGSETADSPASAHRRLRLALRRARDAAGLTQGEVAERLDWSLSKVQRIESGDVKISSTDLVALLGLLGVTDERQVAKFADEARLARSRGWWDQPRYREHLRSPTLQIIQFEQNATAIRVFQPALFPGLLQEPSYAEQVIDTAPDPLSDEARKVRLEVRTRRQESVWGRPDPPQLLVILDELLILRTIHSAAVTARQLKRTLEAIERPEIMVRLLPKELGHFLLIGAFNIYDIGEEENAVLYREFGVSDEVTHGASEINKYRRRFEQMWDLCLTEAATRSAVQAQYSALRASMDRTSS